MKQFNWTDKKGRNIVLDVTPMDEDNKFMITVVVDGKAIAKDVNAMVGFRDWYIDKICHPQMAYLQFKIDGEVKELAIKEGCTNEEDYPRCRYENRVIDYLYDHIKDEKLKKQLMKLTSYSMPGFNSFFGNGIPWRLQKAIKETRAKGFLPLFKYVQNKKYDNVEIDMILGISKDYKEVAKYSVIRHISDEDYECYSDVNNFTFVAEGFCSHSFKVVNIHNIDNSHLGEWIGIEYDYDVDDDEDIVISTKNVKTITWKEQEQLIKKAIDLKWRSEEVVTKDIMKTLYRCVEGLSCEDGMSVISNYMKSASMKRLSKHIKAFLEADTPIRSHGYISGSVIIAFRISNFTLYYEAFEESYWRHHNDVENIPSGIPGYWRLAKNNSELN